MQYNFKESEKKWQEFWEKNKIFAFNSKSKKPVYSIDSPPPYISGKMHIGHAFSYSQQDFIMRFRRMFDGNVFCPFGTDDNGLPTERFVEKINKVKSKSMSRADFIELCLKTLKEQTPDFIQDWKNIGFSADYNIYYSTIDKSTQKISQKSFLDLYNKKEIYKKEFPTLWCIDCQTTVAQAELEDKSLDSTFFTIKFKSNGKDLLIATTRPELIPACVSVFVNPNDNRYKNLIGKKAIIPLFNYEVPIIADESADPNKGTGVLMICSYGDKYDAQSINKYNLVPRVIINPDGTINFDKYKGLKIKEARKAIIEDLKNANLIVEQKPINHVVNIHDKCGTEIEILPTNQWFIKILDKKNKLIEQGRKIKWHPEFMFKRYENWVNGLEWDWSISRDRHFGIPIPVWECEKCNEIILPKENELPIDPLQIERKCPKCKCNAKGEDKVLDTWATSSMTPQIASSLVDGKVKLPFSLRPQAHDIIRTWAFYTIIRAYLAEKKIPWKEIIVSGYVTMGGEKMSKSKDNVIDPLQVLDKYGADALRFWAASSKLGEDLDYQEKDLVTGQKTVVKLWNASLFSLDHLKDFDFKRPKLEIMDKWLLIKLNELVKECTEAFENYEYSVVKSKTENFFWHTFCDYYLEIVKDRIYNPNKRGKEQRKSAQFTLYTSLLTILKLFAPIMPYITEEIYQNYFVKKEKAKSIHISEWPKYNKELGDKKIEKLGDDFINILSKVRQFKTENNKSLKEPINIILEDNKLKETLEDLKAVSNAKIEFGKKFEIKF
ncbi:MAG: valine--tRNA ligase [Nanoarchaeota archaeon]|nr:valine--tRNA ligase [Nanoarchaeota archaeon]MBU0962779.1 valine--tRNA ligase [Nanoarchaeota archaeon]